MVSECRSFRKPLSWFGFEWGFEALFVEAAWDDTHCPPRYQTKASIGNGRGRSRISILISWKTAALSVDCTLFSKVPMLSEAAQKIGFPDAALCWLFRRIEALREL